MFNRLTIGGVLLFVGLSIGRQVLKSDDLQSWARDSGDRRLVRLLAEQDPSGFQRLSQQVADGCILLSVPAYGEITHTALKRRLKSMFTVAMKPETLLLETERQILAKALADAEPEIAAFEREKGYLNQVDQQTADAAVLAFSTVSDDIYKCYVKRMGDQLRADLDRERNV
ncbi:MAG: hypothetical protein AAGJ32_07330 [Pseudomonadota bacterium]